jgi:NCAIR mutase (PurE)-related protein
VDDAKVTQDVKKDEAVPSSEKSSEVKEQSSQEKSKVSEVDIEKEVQKRVSDVLAKKGDKAKTLEERMQTLEAENQSLKDARLKDMASKLGIDVEQVKKVGITEPEKVEALAKLFGKTERQPDAKPDSGKTLGGVTVPDSARGKISAGWEEIHKK